MPGDLDPYGRALSTTSASVQTAAFAAELNRTLATLDTSRYEAVEVIQPRAVPGLPVGGQPQIRLVEQGEPPARELIDEQRVARIVRYDAEDVDRLRTYVEEGSRDDVVRFVERELDVGKHDPETAADRLIRSLEEPGVGEGDA